MPVSPASDRPAVLKKLVEEACWHTATSLGLRVRLRSRASHSLGAGCGVPGSTTKYQGYETASRPCVPCLPKFSRYSRDDWSRPGGCCSNNGKRDRVRALTYASRTLGTAQLYRRPANMIPKPQTRWCCRVSGGSPAYFGAQDRHSATPSDSECTICSRRQTRSSLIQSYLLHSSPQQYTHACARPVPARPRPCRRRAECTPHPHQCHSYYTCLTERSPLCLHFRTSCTDS